jgi:hypothetical protein
MCDIWITDVAALGTAIAIVGLTPASKRVVVIVRDTPHEVLFPVPESYGYEHLRTLRARLEKDLQRRNSNPHCSRSVCETCDPATTLSAFDAPVDDAPEGEDDDGEEEAAYVRTPSQKMNNDPCRYARLIDEAVTHADFVRRRGFIGYEQEDRKFARFVLASAHLASYAKSALVPDPSLPPHHAGGIDECSDPIESFMRLKDCKGFTWWTAKEVRPSRKTRSALEFECSFANFVPNTQLNPNTMQPSVLTYDIETLSPNANRMSTPEHNAIGCIAVDCRTDRVVFGWGNDVRRVELHIQYSD